MLQQLAPARAGSDRATHVRAPVSGAYKVDISRGERIGRVSSEWFSRPDDERYLSLGALYEAVRARADRATARTVETKALRVEASRDAAERLTRLLSPCRAAMHRWRQRIGRSARYAAWWAHPRATCASSRRRSPASTCSTVYCRIAPSW